MPFYRARTGMTLERSATVGDVVRYEQDTLGNELRVPPEQYGYLDKFPYTHCIWAGVNRKVAEQYGDEIVPVEADFVIILAVDEDGGKLLFSPDEPFDIWLR